MLRPILKANDSQGCQAMLSKHFCVKKWLKNLIWGTLKVGISEEGLQQIAILPELDDQF